MGAGGSSISTADGQDGGDTDVDDNDEGDDIDASSDADGKAATPIPLISVSAFATRFCVKFYATLLLFLKILHGHMVSRVNKK